MTISSIADIKTMLEIIGIPIAYRKFETPPDTPYIIFYEERSTNFFADSKVLQKISVIVMELYTNNKNPNLETRIEALLDTWDKAEAYIPEEKLYLVSFEFSTLILDQIDSI